MHLGLLIGLVGLAVFYPVRRIDLDIIVDYDRCTSPTSRQPVTIC